MKTVITTRNQTIFDIAAEHYGDVSKFDKVMELNPSLANDYTEARNLGIEFNEDEFDMSFPLLENQSLLIDSMLVNNQVLRELKNEGIFSFTKIDLDGYNS
jgi:hypothetical protein